MPVHVDRGVPSGYILLGYPGGRVNMYEASVLNLTSDNPIFDRIDAEVTFASDLFMLSKTAFIYDEAKAFLSPDSAGWTLELPPLCPLPLPEATNSPVDSAAGIYPDIFLSKQTAARHRLCLNHWDTYLTNAYWGEDILAGIKSCVGKYLMTLRQIILLASVRGILEESKASHASDMVIDMTQKPGNTCSDRFISPDTVENALAILGFDKKPGYLMVIHPHILSALTRLGCIPPEAISADKLPVYFCNETFWVMLNDNFTVEDKNCGEETVRTFYTYIFSPNAIVLGVSDPTIPLILRRDPEKGHGGGMEGILSKTDWIIHPQGYSFKALNLTRHPSTDELKNPVNWTREWYHKKLKIAAIISRG
jgi:hypothetical protein